MRHSSRLISSFFISTVLFFYATAVRTDDSTVTVAPNLMVILGNSFSMNRKMDDIHYPRYTRDKSSSEYNRALVNANGSAPCPAAMKSDGDPLYTGIPRFDDDGCNDPADTGVGSMAPYRLLGDQPESKFYIAKKTFFDLLDSDVTKNINFGFATFRQAFGLELASATNVTNNTWPKVHPENETTILTTWTDSQKTAFGKDPKNFRNVEWWRIWSNYNNSSALFGKTAGSGANRWENGLLKAYVPLSGGKGLPQELQYRRFPNGQRGVTCSESTCGQRSNHDYQGNDLSTYCQDKWGNTWRCSFGSGGIDTSLQYKYPSNPEEPPKHYLCYTRYNSQANFFQSAWVSNKDFIHNYANKWNPETRYYVYLNEPDFDSSGNINSVSWTEKCWDGVTRTFRDALGRVSNTLKMPDGSTESAYFTYIPDVFEGTHEGTLNKPVGTFSGWSGKASYDPDNDSYSTTYPAGVASDAASAMGSWNKSGVNHMGVFLDLPDPDKGYVDQRETIREWVNPSYPQMDPSGLEYDPSSQTIETSSGEKRSISASILPGSYKSTQSPVYDSLMDAAAYFKAYKEEDSYDNCRSNNILLVIDGKEDGRYTVDSDGHKTFADPSEAAKKLYEELNVKVYVIIISSNQGNIKQADDIAAAGGTHQAYRVASAQDLTKALTAVFTSLKGTVISSGGTSTSSGSKVYVTASDFNTGNRQGHLYAYPVTTAGTIGNLLWDAADFDDPADPNDGYLMTVTLRENLLKSNQADGTICQFNDSSCVADGDLQTSGKNPTASVIRGYTIDPNYDNGTYLANRRKGSLVGTISSRTMKPVYVDRPRSDALAGHGDFRGFVQANANWKPIVLFSSDDGFLYAVDADNGTLKWGWLPRPLLGELKNYETFQQGKPMDGGFTLAYAKNGSSWHTYLVGAGRGGEFHYVVQITTDSNHVPVPDQVIKIDEQSGYTSPHPTAPAIWNDTTGTGYAFYVRNDGSAQGTAYRIRLHDGQVDSVSLNGTASSNATVSELNGEPVVGMADGRLLQVDFANNTTTEITTNSNGGALDGKVDWVGTESVNGGYTYLWATTNSNQIAVYRWDDSGSQWKILWTTKAGGPSTDSYDYNDDNSDGHPIVHGSDPGDTGAGPRWLPGDASITDASAIDKRSGVLLVPGTENNATESSCGGHIAKLYLFRLADGGFPTGTYVKATGNAVTTDITVGLGEAFTPVITYETATSATIVPIASQNNNATPKPGDPIKRKAPVVPKRLNWREIMP